MKLGNKKDVLLGITPYIKELVKSNKDLTLTTHYTLNKDNKENSLYFIQLSKKGVVLYHTTTKLHTTNNNKHITTKLTELLEALNPKARQRALSIKELELP